jgi:hypothetical protein
MTARKPNPHQRPDGAVYRGHPRKTDVGTQIVMVRCARRFFGPAGVESHFALSSRSARQAFIGMNPRYDFRGASPQIPLWKLRQWLITNIEVGPSRLYWSWLHQPSVFWLDISNLSGWRAFSRTNGASAEHSHQK